MPVPLMRFDKFCEFTGISLETGKRFRRKGYIGKLVYVDGRPYVNMEAAAEWARRAEAGEFCKDTPQERKNDIHRNANRPA